MCRNLFLLHDKAIVTLTLESAIGTLFLYLPVRILMYICYMVKMVITVHFILNNLSLVRNNLEKVSLHFF